MLKPFAKRLLFGIAPQWTTALQSSRARAHSHRVVESWGCREINRKLVEHLGSRVLSGPFAGLQLTPSTLAEQIGPYLLGTYEAFLPWDRILARRYSAIIDIGAKFGYYAVGLARLYPDIPVIAYDADWWARRTLREMIEANGVSNVEIRGYCEGVPVIDNSLVICDIDGGEASLLNGPLPATLLIETHDCFVPGVTERLVRVFPGAERIPYRETDTSIPLDFLSPGERNCAVHEVRPTDQEWLFRPV